MKTLQQVKEDVAKTIGFKSWEDYRNKYIISERALERVAKLYAEQFIDAAAEVVKLREMTEAEMIEGDADCIENHMGIMFTINKEAILSLKDQLK